MTEKSGIKDLFSSKWGFIFAAAGSAIGMGNIWLFPYRVGEFGGAAFLIPYIICVTVLGFTALVGEITIGRLTGAGPVGAFSKALQMRGKNGKAGEVFGWLSVIVVFIIAVGYTVIVAWVIRFLIGSFTGSALSAADPAQYFTHITASHIMLWVAVSLVTVCVSMLGGVEKGIERVSKIMIPAFLVLFLILLVRVAFLPNAGEGYKFLLTPHWEFLFNAKTWVVALGQAFYSLSIFGSLMIVYGSYMRKTENIISSARNIVILDTSASIIASLVIIPAVFAFGKDINSGPALMFVTMPEIFKTMAFGQLFMIMFFIGVFFAALTSYISTLEAAVEALQNKFKMARAKALALLAAVAFVCNIYVNGNIGGFMDIMEIHFAPLCALTGGIFAFWITPAAKFKREFETGKIKRTGKWIFPAGRYVFCFLVILIYVLNIVKA
ncbi:MAG: sodium-dependent transporter [Endomicrobium sp.]|jgi:NSS family neurotransmitter:Na+ symporter|nr:sodium-dependent transporter [Endomicrobium sp.]